MKKTLTVAAATSLVLMSLSARASVLNLNPGAGEHGQGPPEGTPGFLMHFSGDPNGGGFLDFLNTGSGHPHSHPTWPPGGNFDHFGQHGFHFSLDQSNLEGQPVEAPVPEPATLGLLALGAGLAGLAARRKVGRRNAECGSHAEVPNLDGISRNWLSCARWPANPPALLDR
jgi:PEP-CTERM motif-containing protein